MSVSVKNQSGYGLLVRSHPISMRANKVGFIKNNTHRYPTTSPECAAMATSSASITHEITERETVMALTLTSNTANFIIIKVSVRFSQSHVSSRSSKKTN